MNIFHNIVKSVKTTTLDDVYEGIKRWSTILFTDCFITIVAKACKGVTVSLCLFARDGKAFKLVRCQYLLGIVKTYKRVS